MGMQELELAEVALLVVRHALVQQQINANHV